MYREALFLFVILVAEGFLEDYLFGSFYNRSADAQKTASVVVTVILGSTLGFVGNHLYMMSAKRKILRIIDSHLTEDETLEKLKRAGGTSLAFLYVLIVVDLLLL